MSNFNLYHHNKEAYEKIKEGFKTSNIVGIVHATGTGKSFNALEYVSDNTDENILYVVPSLGIIEHLKNIIAKSGFVLEKDFPNLKFCTYMSFVNLSREELKNIKVDTLILDEFHHLGAPVWGARINTLLKTHPNIKVLGMTAYTVRDRNTPYERDMANPDTAELFSNHIVSRYDLCDAMVDGVLPKPIYKTAYVNLIEDVDYLEKRLAKLDHNSSKYIDCEKVLRDVKRQIANALSMKELVKENLKPNGKYIYFCPMMSEKNVNDIDTIMKEAKSWFLEMGLAEDEIFFYKSTSEMGTLGKKNRDAFYNDIDLDNRDTSNKLRVMFAINQYNEGVHAPNVDGVILGRSTCSDIVYFEQIGRALAVRGDTEEKLNKLSQMSLEELTTLARNDNLEINSSDAKEDIANKLVSPLIIDLSNNYEYILELENDLKDKIREASSRSGMAKLPRNLKITNYRFDIELVNKDLYDMLSYVRSRLSLSWEEMYELAKKYYEYHGDLEIPVKFKTINGYEYNDTGVNLGRWLHNQRENQNLSDERRNLLSNIGMHFKDYNDLQWNKYYELAKKYYEHYGNLIVPFKFKTINGYEYDEAGVSLGVWIVSQRRNKKLTDERKKLLLNIGMQFGGTNDFKWNENYELAKKYFEHHGDLEIPQKFKTINGYEYDATGVNLGIWLATQRQNKNLSDKRKKLLASIGMRLRDDNDSQWNKNYELAKKYYEYHGDLEIPVKFKTINGYEYNDTGVNLGPWLCTQRQNKKISNERRRLLNNIGMRLRDDNDSQWNKNYELAKKYYEHYGNLIVPFKFKTINGYEYNDTGVNLGPWLYTQRQNKNLSDERRNLLSNIGMRFEDYNDLQWNKYYELAKKYYEHYGILKIPTKFKTINGYEYDATGVNLGIWLVTQRQNKNLSEERRRLLSDIGMRFEDYYDFQWNKNYELAKKYYEYHGDLEIPQKFKTINGYEYNDTGVNLGTWLCTQRQNKKISNERRRLLNNIGMRLRDDNDSQWNKNYELAKKYYEYYGNLIVPFKFKTINGYEYNDTGVNLGTWLYTQRQNKNLSDERRNLLSNIGMHFKDYNDLQWNKYYELAKKYYEHYGNLIVPFKFKTINGYEFNETGINLGSWLSTQRQNKNLSEERRRLLSNIGMRFISLKEEKIWYSLYEQALKFYKQYGAWNEEKLDEIDNKDIMAYGSILTWLKEQRKNKNLNKDMEECLSNIGFIFDTDKNTAEIRKVCTEYNIPYEDNKDILDNISAKELIIKIRYLLDNKINIVDRNNKLYEIFRMSNQEMIEKYHVSFEELYDKYLKQENLNK